MNKRHLNKLIVSASEIKILICIIVLLALNARRKLPHLHPRQVLIPATIIQMIIFAWSITHPPTHLITATLGNLIVVGFAIIPSTVPHPVRAHWVRPHYDRH